MTVNPLDYPAVTPGAVVTEGHAHYCREHGHAKHTVDGAVSPLCPRCGEPVAMWQAYVEVVAADVLSYPDDPTDFPTAYRVNVGDSTASIAHATVALLAHLSSKGSDVGDALLNGWVRKYGEVTDGAPTGTLRTALNNNGRATVQLVPLRAGVERVTDATG